MGRISRSFALMGQSFTVLMRDKELMVLPVLSGIIVVSMVVLVWLGFGIRRQDLEQGRVETYVALFALSFVSYAVSIFFQAAVVAGATERMRGGDPTVGSAIEAASKRIGRILIWAAVASTVGVLLRSLENKMGFIGKIVVRIVGAAWALATLFVVPSIVLEDTTVRESFHRSIEVFKTTWGESMVGSINLAAAGAVAWVTLIAVTGLVGWAGAGVGALWLFVPCAIVLAVLFSTLQGVFVASLYRYAVSGEANGIDRDLLSSAFAEKAR